MDEILGRGRATDWSHRIAAGRGGGWRPANGLKVSRATHRWLHAHPMLARLGGWHVRTEAVLQQTPVWLALPWAGWWLIDDLVTDGPHLLIPLPEWRPRPRLPFEPQAHYVNSVLLNQNRDWSSRVDIAPHRGLA